MARKASRPRSSGGPGYATMLASAALVCLAVAVALLGHLRLKGEIYRMDAENSRLEHALVEARKTNVRLQNDYETLISPRGLEDRIRDMRLRLIMPGDVARVVLPEPRADEPAPPSLPASRAGRDGRLALLGSAATVNR